MSDALWLEALEILWKEDAVQWFWGGLTGAAIGLLVAHIWDFVDSRTPQQGDLT